MGIGRVDDAVRVPGAATGLDLLDRTGDRALDLPGSFGGVVYPEKGDTDLEFGRLLSRVVWREASARGSWLGDMLGDAKGEEILEPVFPSDDRVDFEPER